MDDFRFETGQNFLYFVKGLLRGAMLDEDLSCMSDRGGVGEKKRVQGTYQRLVCRVDVGAVEGMT